MARTAWLLGAIGVALAGRWACTATDERPDADPYVPGSGSELQSAVIKDGFVVLETDPRERRLALVDRDGKQERRVKVPIAADAPARAIGSPKGPLLAHLRDRKLDIARVKKDGSLDKAQTFGRSISRVCDGIATTDHLWSVGFVDGKSDLWRVWGPTRDKRSGRAADAEALVLPASSDAARAAIRWCAIAPADEQIALLWQEGTRRLFAMCTGKDCGMTARLPLEPNQPMLGAGCLRTGCAIVFSDPKRGRMIGWVSPTGKPQWSKPLPATSDRVSLTTAGPGSVIVGYQGPEGSEVVKVSPKGTIERVWRGADDASVPAVSWSRDRLLITSARGATIVRVPR